MKTCPGEHTEKREIRQKETFYVIFQTFFRFCSWFWIFKVFSGFGIFLILFRFSQFSRFFFVYLYFRFFCKFLFFLDFLCFFFAPLYRILYDISQRQQKYFFLILILDENNHSHPFRYSLTLNPFQFVYAANHVGMDMSPNFLSMFGTERWRILGNGERHGCNVLSKHCHEDTCLHGRQHRDWYHRW